MGCAFAEHLKEIGKMIFLEGSICRPIECKDWKRNGESVLLLRFRLGGRCSYDSSKRDGETRGGNQVRGEAAGETPRRGRSLAATGARGPQRV